MTGVNSLITFELHLTLSPDATPQLVGSSNWLCFPGSLTGNLSYNSSDSPEMGTSGQGRVNLCPFRFHSAINPK